MAKIFYQVRVDDEWTDPMTTIEEAREQARFFRPAEVHTRQEDENGEASTINVEYVN